MKCCRCGGLMVVDHYIDMEDSSSQGWLRAWRCVICGNVEDPKIHRHRILQRSGLDRLAKALSRVRHQEDDVVPLGV